MRNDNKPFTELLLETRRGKGLSMEAVAKELGVRYSAYRLWETGAARPNAEHLGRVCLWLELPVPTVLRHLGTVTRQEEQALLKLRPGSGHR